MLGTDEYASSGRAHRGVFEKSAVESARLPSTLKRVEYCAFKECAGLRRIELPEALEYIGQMCFAGSGLEKVQLPASVRVVGTGAFENCAQLRYVELNEGLRTLGGTWRDGDKEFSGMAFARSGIRRITIPSTLRALEAETFYECKSLAAVQLQEGLEEIGTCAFASSGLESVVLPPSTRTVGSSAFEMCERLRSARLNEGLEALGVEERVRGRECAGRVFQWCTLKSVVVPSTLRAAGSCTFAHCGALKRIEFSEGIESLGGEESAPSVWSQLFKGSGVREVVLPGTLREVSPSIFAGCECLRVVRVARGCSVDVQKLVDKDVRVRRK